MANLPAELKSLPLEHIIGSPLEAAIKAQALAARTTVDFIKDVGLTTDPATNEVSAVLVDFKFDRTLEEMQAPLVAGGPQVKNFRIVPSKLSVPLLAMLPIPYIRITDMSIDFEYKIRDVDTREHEDQLGVKTKASAKYWFVKAEVSGSFSNKNNNKRETDRSTSLKINVNAAQDQIPEGLARVLDMMHDQLTVVPLTSGTLLPQPASRIDSISPAMVANAAPAGGAAWPTFKLTGVGLSGATKASVEGLAAITFNIAAAAAPNADTKLDVTFTAGLPVAAGSIGEKTLRIETPQGVATAKFTIS